MREDTFIQDTVQRLTKTETNMSIILEERPKIQQEILEMEKNISENQQNTEHLQEEIDELNKRINMFIGAVGTLLLTIISAGVTILLR
jgi:septal ring factor EnvC (AmiA/AmiB activator)